jgi:hypothetical protein
MATILAQVRAATLQNVTLANNLILGSASIDGVTIASGNRILVKAQTDKVQNGIYTIASTGAWSRATDFAASSSQTGGTIVFVQEGSTLADTGWVISSDGTLTVGTDLIQFEKFSINLKLDGASVSSSMILRSEKGYPLTIQELDNNFKYLSVSLTKKLNTVDFTPIAIRDKINTLSAGDANLNAWKLNGYLPAEAANASTVVIRSASGGITSTNFYGNLIGNADTASLADVATIANNVSGIVALANGGSGSNTAAGARTNLGAVGLAGDTMTGKLVFAAANASRASLNITPRTAAVNSPVNGDVWADASNLFYRLNNINQTIAPLDSPVFTGAPNAPTATNDSNSNAIATTAFVNNIKVLIDASIALKSSIASPTFTGTPLSPTPATSDNSTKIATTAYTVSKVADALTSYTTTTGMNSAIATALTSYTTTTGMNSAIATAITPYYTKTQIDNTTSLNNYYTKTQTDNVVSTALTSYTTTTGMNSAISTALTSYTTTTGMNSAISSAVSPKATTAYVDGLQDKWGTSRKFVQSSDPGGAAVDGDIWFKI